MTSSEWSNRAPSRARLPCVSLGIRACREAYIAEAIESVCAQTFGDFEVIVADDRAQLRSLVEGFGDGRIRYVANHHRLGAGENARRVLGLARGRLIGLLDDDDVLLPTFLEEVVARFRADEALDIVFTNHYIDTGSGAAVRRMPVAEGTHRSFLPLMIRHLPAPTSATLMRRHVWKDGETRFRPEMGNDAGSFLWTAVVLHAAEHGCSFHYIDRPLMVYRVHALQLSSDPRVMRETGVALWELFSFRDEISEGLRRNRLAEALLSRAALRLKADDFVGAKCDAARARAASPGVRRWRRWVLATLAARPSLLPVARLFHELVKRRRL